MFFLILFFPEALAQDVSKHLRPVTCLFPSTNNDSLLTLRKLAMLDSVLFSHCYLVRYMIIEAQEENTWYSYILLGILG